MGLLCCQLTGSTEALLPNFHIDFEIITSDDKIFPFVRMPSEFKLTARSTILQPMIKMFNIELKLDIVSINTCGKIWKAPTYMGMKVGMSSMSGKITWSDDEGDQEVELNGVGNIWSMRALL